MGGLARRLAAVLAVALPVSLLVAPVAADEGAPTARSASAACEPGASVSTIASVSGSVVSGGVGVSGAHIYAYDLELGTVACVLSGLDGSYVVPLPGVSEGSSLRRPVDGWVIAASAPAASSLGGTSRAIAWNAVARTATLAIPELELGASTVSVRPSVSGQAVAAPTLVCAGFDSSQFGGPCGVVPASSSSPVLLATGTTSSQSVFAQSRVGSAWWRAWDSTGTPGSTLALPLEREVADTEGRCTGGKLVTGSVTRDVDGSTAGLSAGVVALGLWNSAGVLNRAYLGETTSNRDGTFALCVNFANLPGATTSGAQLVLAASSAMGGVVTVAGMAGGCVNGCSGEDVRLEESPDIGGVSTYTGKSGLAAQVPFAWWSVHAGYIEQGNPIYSLDVHYGMTGPDGSWGLAFADALNPLPNGQYLATLSPPNGRGGYVSTYAAFTSTASAAAVDVALKLGNLVGAAVGADGSPLAWSWLSARQVDCSANCTYRGGSTDSRGNFALDLPDGTFEVTAYAPWGNPNSVSTTKTVVVAGGVVITFGGDAPSSPLVFTLDGPNARVLVRSGGTPVPNTYVAVRGWSESQGLTGYQESYTSSAGVAGLRLEPGNYVVNFDHWGEEFVPSFVQHWEVTQSGGDLSIKTCSISGRAYLNPCPESASRENMSRTSGGEWIIGVPTPNIVATVKSPEGDVNVARSTVCLLQEYTAVWGPGSDYLSCRGTNEAGKTPIYLPPSGTFTVRVYPPWDTDEDWVAASYKFKTSADGSVCSVVSEVSCIGLGGPQVSLPLSGPNLIASITGVGGDALTGGWTSVEKSCSRYPNCRDWVTSASVSQRGRLSLKLDASDDTYYLRVYPWNLADGSVETTFAVRVQDASVVQNLSLQLKAPNVTGTVTDSLGLPVSNVYMNVQQSLGGQWTWVNAYASTAPGGAYRLLLDPGTYRLLLQPQPGDSSRAVPTTSPQFTVGSGALTLDVTLRAPNLTGVVKLPSGAIASNSWIDVQKWFDAYGYYGWSDEASGIESSAGGRFGLNLPIGRWRLLVYPPWGALTASRTVIPVRSDGAGVCLDVAPHTTCAPSRYLSSSYEITLEAPNASGNVRMPDGIGEVAYAWVEVHRWIDDTVGFSWDFDLPAAVTGPKASYAVKLPIGRWRLTANPDTSVTNATRNSIDVTVDGAGLCLTKDAPCGGADLIATGALNISLRSPNVTGVIRAGAQAVPYAWAHLERWSSTDRSWSWTGIYGWTRESGRYVMSAIDDGEYRVRAQSNSSRGYTDGYSYLDVDAGKICELTDSPESVPMASCRGTGDHDDSVVLSTALTPANLIAEVRGGSQTVPWTWVQLQEQVGANWTWRPGTYTLEDGSVSLTLNVDDSAVYRLRVDPPWGTDVEYVRTYAEFVAYRDGAVTRTCAPANWNSVSGSCSSPVTDTAPLVVNLNVGGLRGRVTTPDGSSGIASSWVEVQQWLEYPWNPGVYGWIWIDAYSYARTNGNFTLNLDSPGVYRLTAYPTWPNLQGWSRRTVIVEVDADGAWCKQNPIVGSGPVAGFGPCDDPTVMTSERLTMPLLTSNLIGVLVFDDTVDGVRSSRPMPYGWVNVHKETGEWVASVSTSDQGRFAIFLEDDTYVVTGYPNWRFAQRPPLSKTVVVRDGVIVPGLPGGELRIDFDEIPPNVLVTVPLVGQRLVAVERDGDGDTNTVDWELMTEYSSSTNGSTPNIAGLNLPPGIYRLSVIPDIGRRIASGGVLEVMVPASGTVDVSVPVTEADA